MMKMMACAAAALSSVGAAVPNTSGRQLQDSTCADLNGDGLVDVSDLLSLLAAYSTSPAGDTNGDGTTDVTDLLVLLGAFGGPSCSPGEGGGACTSRLSCDELGTLYGGDWRTTTNNFRRGSDQVCGESDTGFLGDDGNLCFGGSVDGGADTVTEGWGHAGSICTSIGARLCTVAELQAEETRGTGCQHDNEWVWSSDSCVGGHLVAVGGNHNGRNRCVDSGECTADQNPCTCNARCWPDYDAGAVRCCADADTTIADNCRTVGYTTGCSALTCDELGAAYGGDWRTTTNNFRRGSDQVCGESDAGFNTDNSNLCFGGSVAGGADTATDGWGHAATICVAIGSRLCTVAELQAEETRGTGCQHDNEWVWAADTCDGGHLTAVGGNHCSGENCGQGARCDECAAAAAADGCVCPAQCLADSESAAVRCCADVAGPDCNPPLPAIADIATASVDSDGDCRADDTGCYTTGVLSASADLKYYGDRNYVMTEIPPFLTAMNFVRTANDDKNADAANLEFLCFNVDDDATVYVLYDSRATSLPTWLSSDYIDRHEQAAMHTDTNMADGFEIYYREVAPGRVCLGGNGGSDTGAASNYLVVVGPAGVHAVSAAPPEPVGTLERACEGAELAIDCGSDTINVLTASYGRQHGSEVCPHAAVSNQACHADESFNIVSAACQGQSSCTIAVTNGVFGDPCGGTYKYLSVEYQCAGAEDACTSALSCEELGTLYGGDWRTTTNNFRRGSDQVCGESDAGFDEDNSNLCFGGSVAGGADTATDGWGHASSICMAIGSRLCTVAELQAEETRGTGCQHDNEWVWSADECTEGHFVAVGGNHCSGENCGQGHRCDECVNAAAADNCICPAQCWTNSQHGAVRCCADVDTSIAPDCAPPAVIGCSALTCDELGAAYGQDWRTTTNNFRRGSDQVCGESDAGFNADNSNLCFGGSVAGGADTVHDGWGHASGICVAIGSRLCTVAELQAEETRGTGCQHDNEWVWASDTCDGGHLTAVGGNHCSGENCGQGARCDECAAAAAADGCVCPARCIADAITEPAVRCCADVAGPGCNDAPGPSGDAVALVGMVTADLTGVTVTYTGAFPDPVVIAGIPTHNGDEEMAVRVTSITQNSISLYADVPNHAAAEGVTSAVCGGASHAPEMFGWMIISSGIYTGGIEASAGTYGQCAGGSLCTPELGCATCDHATGFDWLDVPFTIPIEDAVVVSQIQSHTGGDWVKTRQRNINTQGFQIKQEEDGLDAGHNTEVYGWIAMPAGAGTMSGNQYEAIRTPDAVTHEPYTVAFTATFGGTVPAVFGSMQSFDGGDPSHLRLNTVPAVAGVDVFVEEETCSDAELAHTTETVGILAVQQNFIPPPPVEVVAAGALSVEIGQAADVVLADTVIPFTGAYTDPVIILGTPSHNGDEEAVVRVNAIGSSDFTVYLDIPNHAAGEGAICGGDTHVAETFSWMIVDSGSYSEGLQAGATTGGICAGGDLCIAEYGCPLTCDHSTGFDWVTISFTPEIANPVVISQIQSHTGGDWVKTRQRNVQSTGFEVKMEEDGLDVGHNTEMFGWVALPAGQGTMSGLVFEAIKTPDAVTHEPYDITFSAQFDIEPAFFSAMQSFDGGDPSHMRQSSVTTAGATFWVEEETCSDAELGHTAETVGILAIQTGAVGGDPEDAVGCTSALSCDELGTLYGGDWRTTTNNFRRGSDQVCGESDTGFLGDDGNACLGGDLHGNGSGDLGSAQNDIVTDGWVHAASICTAIGARLCTIAEIQAEETRGTGCGHDAEWLWSSDSCVGGHLVAVGGNHQGRNLCTDTGECTADQNPCTCNARCWVDAQNAAVRCCADVDVSIGETCAAVQYTTGCSALTCDELGTLYGQDWRTTTNNFRRGSDQVCGESNAGFNTDNSNLCFGGSVAGGADTAHDGWMHAASICVAIGSRLCTVAELQAEETRGTGCSHDNEWVWASDTCDGGHLTAVGGNHCSGENCGQGARCDECAAAAAADGCVCPARCIADVITEPAVRCCADVAGPACVAEEPPPEEPSACTSALTCDELGTLYGGDWRTTTNNFRRGSDQVCGESDTGFLGDDGNACLGGDLHGNGSGALGSAQNDIVTDGWVHAASICTAIGARLCTIAEIQAEETRGTGCGHDAEWLWGSESCAEGHLVAVGGNHQGRNLCTDTGECTADQNPCTCNARCWPDISNAAVRCCADVDVSIGETCAAVQYNPGCSALTCDDLGAAYGQDWRTTTNNFRRGSDQVCGESDAGFGQGAGSRGGGDQECYGGQVVHNANSASETDTVIEGWSHGASICRAVGARLCTADELQADETRGSGCAHDREWVWSSTECDGGHLIAVGGNQWGSDMCGDEATDGSAECQIPEADFNGNGTADPCVCNARCSEDGVSHAVRCCADVLGPLCPADSSGR